MKRVSLGLVALSVLFLVPGAAATTIAEEDIMVDLGEETSVTVTQRYASIDTELISYLVPANFQASGLEAHDGIGPMSCTVETVDTGKQLLCEPRARQNYTVTITYDGVFSERRPEATRFSYLKTVSIPTQHVTIRVVLPEGYGLIDTEQPYSPNDAEVGSAGRRIFVAWEVDDPDLGSLLRFTIRYEELAVFGTAVPDTAYLIGGILLLLLGIGLGVYIRNRRVQGKTIASIFPLLKDDERDVLRYIIDEGGEVEQRDVVANVNYSKAKISRVISDLADRNLVEKEKEGRVNIVRVTRDIGDLNGS